MGDPKGGAGVREKTRTKKAIKTSKPPLFRVLIHNDDFTPMEFVVLVLMQIFHMDETTATTIMLAVHHQGMGVAGVYPKDIAESKAHLVVSLAGEFGHPLLATVEEDGPPEGESK